MKAKEVESNIEQAMNRACLKGWQKLNWVSESIFTYYSRLQRIERTRNIKEKTLYYVNN